MKLHILRRHLSLRLCLLCAAWGAGPHGARAATFTIANGDVAALKSALNTANINNENDTINLAAKGTYTLTTVDSPVIGSDGGHPLVIAGNGAALARSTASGTPNFRILQIGSGALANISGLTLSNGKPGGTLPANSGGGITNQGTLILGNCTLSGNHAPTDGGARGGGLFNQGTATLTDCTCINNNAEFGGGIANDGALTLRHCTLGGSVTQDGGGIFNDIHGTVNLTGTTLSGNRAGSGGGILNQAKLTANNCTFSDNAAARSSTDGGGGAIRSFGTLTLTGCTFSHNTCSTSGGARGGAVHNAGGGTLTGCTFNDNGGEFGAGLANRGTLALHNCACIGNIAQNGGGLLNDLHATLTLTGTTLSGNRTGSGGAGITNQGTLTLTNCTLSGNSVGGGFGHGGGIENDAPLTLTNCTLSGNSVASGSGSKGGGLYTFGANPTILNTIIAGNSASTGPDVSSLDFGPVNSQGHNFIGKIDGSSGWIASDLTGTSAAPLDPKLGPLQDNGGPTPTLALQPASPAIDAGDDAVLGAPLNLTIEQRGPGFSRQLGAHVDVGAFEFDSPQSGSDFTVTTNQDHDDGFCGARDCTLREAIKAANAASGANLINFDATLKGTIGVTAGTLDVTGPTTISGPGARNLAVSSFLASRIFAVSAGPCKISGLTIRSGAVTGTAFGASVAGGAILNQATLTLAACTLSSNRAQGGNVTLFGGAGGTAQGGAIANLGALTLSRCTFNGNSATGGRGGPGFFNGHFRIGGGNGGAGQGGAIFNGTGATLTLNNCTFASNNATGGAGGVGSSGNVGGLGANGDGGGVFNQGSMTVTACTLSANRGSGGAGGTGSTAANDGAPGSGSGGLNSSSASASTVRNTLCAVNFGDRAGGDVNGAFISGGYNLIGSGTGSTGFSNGVNADQVGVSDPRLGPLADNGGPTNTMALLATSPALDQGNSFGVTIDERGAARPSDHPSLANAPGGDGSDIGAFEAQPPTISSFSPANGLPSPPLQVVITGTEFVNVQAVKFNGVIASFGVNSPTRITAVLPTTASTGPISVITPTGTATSKTSFTVKPGIKLFTPSGGDVGASVVIQGWGLNGATAVKFHGAGAAFTVNSVTQITATVPAAATTGQISVTTAAGTALSATDFMVPGCAEDVSAQVEVTRGTVQLAGSYSECFYGHCRWRQTVTLQSRSATTMAGPLSLVLDNLGSGATLANANGVTECSGLSGSPFVAAPGDLAPGATVSVTLEFEAAQVGDIRYDSQVLAGPHPR